MWMGVPCGSQEEESFLCFFNIRLKKSTTIEHRTTALLLQSLMLISRDGEQDQKRNYFLYFTPSAIVAIFKMIENILVTITGKSSRRNP